MAAVPRQINSREEAIAVLQDKINQFADELSDVTSGLGVDTKELLNSLREGNLDPQKRDKVLRQFKSMLENTWWNKMWTYGVFVGCIVLILVVFVFVGYYKLYKPMADKERKQIEKKDKKQKREQKRHAKQH